MPKLSTNMSLTAQDRQLLTAKRLSHDADELHDALCKQYGENAYVSMYALQSSISAFLTYCELEQLNQDVPLNTNE